MFAQVHHPQKLLPGELDGYLERGWFRMGQTIFTTNFLNFRHQLYGAIWLRIVLPDLTHDKQQQKLMKRNAGFRTEVKRASINAAKEELYAKYKLGISFEVSSSLKELMYRNSLHDLYHTLEVCVYDQGKLIGAGFFDIGATSGAGITSFYDPDYKKYSLGKYLIYQKLEYCKASGLSFFYPGYFVPGYSFFNYKLGIGTEALQYLDFSSQHWLPIDQFSVEKTPLHVMHKALSTLRALLQQFRIESSVLMYEFFDANLIPELKDAGLFDFPVLLCFPYSEDDSIHAVVVYDVQDEKYRLIRCISVWASNLPDRQDGFFSSHLLKIIQEIFSSAVPEEMAAALLVEMKSRIAG
ncbi:arginyl-tRNA--protein arginylyltransferase [Fulvivirgaceae bacterium PWU4]|uniref:Arginyl-tRNA--protein arginylyltransferase n=1 Tax=Chryseosolibacter histidini TaxID=2782349 RepID=A0AAP2DL52_9BACT|nr:arginyl-tRNA--protein arginylyltransferase [Chryseosolibacter histidini]MBT1696957.1 arginyl-tRNA--protein arginylyltransferase [Chryseosolibacter histidini]